MKKKSLLAVLTICIGALAMPVWAAEIIQPINVPVSQPVSTDLINIEVPISRAEFITILIEAGTGRELPLIMDTHYAMSAMQKAQELGLIDLTQYPMEIWLEDMPIEEKVEILDKAKKNNGINMEQVYKILKEKLIEQVIIDEKVVEVKSIEYYRGKVMLPLRDVAEAMGFEVTWDADTYTATLNNDEIKSKVQIGTELYNYYSVKAIGMSAPFSVGVAPKFIEGSVYVPYEYFSMFADWVVMDQKLVFTLKK